nr:MAG TPA: hypothetical protein [Caudoviricetes sp.]
MYESSSTYTWWDIEDSTESLATQAVGRWEALGLPKGATENPVVLQVWTTREGETAYTIALLYGDVEVYTAEGCIKISGASRRVAATAAESAIFESAESIVGKSAADELTKGLQAWLRQ